MSEYRIANMRVIYPSGKVAERNPDRFAMVYGNFADAKGNKLTIASKEITNDDAMDATTVIDTVKGVLILPSGTRGRKAIASATQDDITARLANLRKGASK